MARATAATEVVGLGVEVPASDPGAWVSGDREFLPTLHSTGANAGPCLKARVVDGAWSDRVTSAIGRALSPTGGRDVAETKGM